MSRYPFPYDRFHRPPGASERPTIDDRPLDYPEPYLSDRIVAWGILACACVLAFLIFSGWV